MICVHVQNIPITGVTNSHIQDITSFNSKLFHINVTNSKHLTLQRITIDAPQESLNTDGIHIGRSSFINVTDANIKTGDDCVSLGDGSQNINVEKVTCGSGHGISIGSLGRYVLTEIENNYVTQLIFGFVSELCVTKLSISTDITTSNLFRESLSDTARFRIPQMVLGLKLGQLLLMVWPQICISRTFLWTTSKPTLYL